ncbi:YcjF family protein [Enterovibrio sp. ZSDZ42]|uniref:YcjF family protein n=1 Tax=Enterovibrio gelatinilyticus TaxID=2899819 RepID=A0ABT5R3J5_9GAMM|nr:TIGR01620 family protein [Enterovibrio sp. ZSDZ42]MDD1794841.1 YcjF family protein [Enterovibrio sp. ZSDZ42]
MSDYKKAMVFEDTQKPKDDAPELTLQKQFDSEAAAFAVTEIEPETEAEQILESALTAKKKRWGVRALAVAGIGLVGWQTIDSVWTAVQASDWLAVGWSGFVAGIAAMGIAALGREFIALRRLKGRQDEREQVLSIIDADGIGKAKSVCEKLAKQANSEMTAGYDKWQTSLAATHNDREVFELYDQMVVVEQDIRAKKMVTKYASEAAVMVALSPLALADMLLVAWRNFRLLEQVSTIYGVKLGYWSRIRLLRLVLANMAFAGASEAMTDIGTDLLSVDLAGKLSARAAQGLGVGLLTARLGYKAMAVMRPLPYVGTKAPKLSDMRKQLLRRLTSSKK